MAFAQGAENHVSAKKLLTNRHGVNMLTFPNLHRYCNGLSISPSYGKTVADVSANTVFGVADKSGIINCGAINVRVFREGTAAYVEPGSVDCPAFCF